MVLIRLVLRLQVARSVCMVLLSRLSGMSVVTWTLDAETTSMPTFPLSRVAKNPVVRLERAPTLMFMIVIPLMSSPTLNDPQFSLLRPLTSMPLILPMADLGMAKETLVAFMDVLVRMTTLIPILVAVSLANIPVVTLGLPGMLCMAVSVLSWLRVILETIGVLGLRLGNRLFTDPSPPLSTPPCSHTRANGKLGSEHAAR